MLLLIVTAECLISFCTKNHKISSAFVDGTLQEKFMTNFDDMLTSDTL